MTPPVAPADVFPGEVFHGSKGCYQLCINVFHLVLAVRIHVLLFQGPPEFPQEVAFNGISCLMESSTDLESKQLLRVLR